MKYTKYQLQWAIKLLSQKEEEAWKDLKHLDWLYEEEISSYKSGKCSYWDFKKTRAGERFLVTRHRWVVINSRLEAAKKALSSL